MKRYINITLTILAVLLISCGHETEKYDMQNYTPPSLKYRPRLLYPSIAQENAYTGNPKVIISISKAGTVVKTDLINSSGYEILDNAALAFCSDLIFNPAVRNGQPVISKMAWEIKFNFYEQPWDAEKYVKEIELLYKEYENAEQSGKNEILRKILALHNEFVSNMKDGVNFNFIIEKVISNNLSNEWKRDWDSWPLSFLLFHDFLQRFPDYDSLENAKAQLMNAVKIDIQYIQNISVNDSKVKDAKDYIILRINQFIKDRYPNISSELSNQVVKNIQKINS